MTETVSELRAILEKDAQWRCMHCQDPEGGYLALCELEMKRIDAYADKKVCEASERLIALIPHNDVWGNLIGIDPDAPDNEVEILTADGTHGVDPKPFGNWGAGLNPEPCKRCVEAAALTAGKHG